MFIADHTTISSCVQIIFDWIKAKHFVCSRGMTSFDLAHLFQLCSPTCYVHHLIHIYYNATDCCRTWLEYHDTLVMTFSRCACLVFQNNFFFSCLYLLPNSSSLLYIHLFTLSLPYFLPSPVVISLLLLYVITVQFDINVLW